MCTAAVAKWAARSREASRTVAVLEQHVKDIESSKAAVQRATKPLVTSSKGIERVHEELIHADAAVQASEALIGMNPVPPLRLPHIGDIDDDVASVRIAKDTCIAWFDDIEHTLHASRQHFAQVDAAILACRARKADSLTFTSSQLSECSIPMLSEVQRCVADERGRLEAAIVSGNSEEEALRPLDLRYDSMVRARTVLQTSANALANVAATANSVAGSMELLQARARYQATLLMTKACGPSCEEAIRVPSGDLEPCRRSHRTEVVNDGEELTDSLLLTSFATAIEMSPVGSAESLLVAA
jgi:hypothetical protein